MVCAVHSSCTYVYLAACQYAILFVCLFMPGYFLIDGGVLLEVASDHRCDQDKARNHSIFVNFQCDSVQVSACRIDYWQCVA